LNNELRNAQGEAGILNWLAADIHKLNSSFYIDPVTREALPFDANSCGLKIALIHSELSEMLEGVRKDKMDDHLPARKAEEVECADALIRLLDYAAWRKLDIAAAVREKLAYNAQRADHKLENRAAPGGKKF
jgi:hypothetical protein